MSINIEQTCIEFESEFNKFTNNISRLIDKINVHSELKKIYSDAVAECGNIHDECKLIILKYETAIKFQLRELKFYNVTCEAEWERQKKCGVKRLLDASVIILESINKIISESKFGMILDILRELIQLATGLYYKDNNDLSS